MPSKSFKLFVSSIGLAQASFDTIAGYIPGSQVTDHNAIDLDQLAFENIIDDSTNVNRWAEGYAVYNLGGNSRPQVTLTLNGAERASGTGTDIAISSGTNIYQTVGSAVVAVATRTTTTATGTSVGPIRYTISDSQTTYVNCRGQGPVSATSTTLDASADPVNAGCLSAGTICVDPTLPARTPAEVTTCAGGTPLTVDSVAHSSARTIRGFTGVAGSTGSNYPGYRSMAPTFPTYSCPGCPYRDFLWFYQYYGDLAYGDTITMAALGTSAGSWAGTDVTWGTGSPAAANFPVTLSGASAGARREVATKSTNYLTIVMYAIREFEDAIDDCKDGEILRNDDPVHAWDEGVAFYTGSLEGEAGRRGRSTGSPYGVLFWNLADYRCQNFKTCSGTSGTSGVSNVNQNLIRLFGQGATTLQRGECNAVRPIIESLINQIRVPLIQGTLRYTYRVGLLAGSCSDLSVCYAEGGTFAAGILPVVHHCSPTAAATIASSINLGAGTATGASYSYVDFPAVKAAFESVYGCMNLTCADVGGLYDTGNSGYYTGAEPCIDPAPPSAPPLSPPVEAEEVIPNWAIAIIAAIGALFFFIGICFCYVIQMEKAGKPLFVSMPKGGASSSSSNAAV